MGDAFKIVSRTTMTPWTQDCTFFVLLTISDAGIGVEPDPGKRGLGLEEQWFTRWSDILSFEHVRPPQPIVRLEFSIAGGQTIIRDIRVPPLPATPLAECSGVDLIEATLLAYQDRRR